MSGKRQIKYLICSSSSTLAFSYSQLLWGTLLLRHPSDSLLLHCFWQQIAPSIRNINTDKKVISLFIFSFWFYTIFLIYFTNKKQETIISEIQVFTLKRCVAPLQTLYPWCIKNLFTWIYLLRCGSALLFQCHLVFGGFEPLEGRDGEGIYGLFLATTAKKWGAVDTASLSLTLCPTHCLSIGSCVGTLCPACPLSCQQALCEGTGKESQEESANRPAQRKHTNAWTPPPPTQATTNLNPILIVSSYLTVRDWKSPGKSR